MLRADENIIHNVVYNPLVEFVMSPDDIVLRWVHGALDSMVAAKCQHCCAYHTCRKYMYGWVHTDSPT